MYKKAKLKRDILEDTDSIPYKKSSKKTPPKKASHKHTYEPVVLRYFNKYMKFTREKGFIGELDTRGGRRCTICGCLKVGFPKDFESNTHKELFCMREDLLITYPDLPIVDVEDIWNL